VYFPVLPLLEDPGEFVTVQAAPTVAVPPLLLASAKERLLMERPTAATVAKATMRKFDLRFMTVLQFG
jgi:hypothetical protein